MTESTAIEQRNAATDRATPERSGHSSLAFSDMEHGLRLAATVQKAGMYPHYKSPEQIVMAITRGYELGMTPHQSLTSIIVIEGRYSLSAEAMRALVLSNLRADRGEYFIVNSDDTKAVAKAFRYGWPEAQTRELTCAQLSKTNTGNNPNFKTRPRVMLSARVTSEACRDWFADITGGFYTPDEMQEIVDSERAPVAALPRVTNAEAAKSAFNRGKTPAAQPEPRVYEAELIRDDTATEAQAPEPVEFWTGNVVAEWMGEFERCDSLEKLDAVTAALKAEKLAHPAVPTSVHEQLTAAYRGAKARTGRSIT